MACMGNMLLLIHRPYCLACIASEQSSINAFFTLVDYKPHENCANLFHAFLKLTLFVVYSHQRTGPLFTLFDSNFCCFSFQENGLSFSLEAVRRLHELAESNSMSGQQSPRLRASTMSLCADPMLPQEFLPLCRQRGASASLARLGTIIDY